MVSRRPGIGEKDAIVEIRKQVTAIQNPGSNIVAVNVNLSLWIGTYLGKKGLGKGNEYYQESK